MRTPPSQDPTVGLNPGSDGGPSGGPVSYEQGTPVAPEGGHESHGHPEPCTLNPEP